VYDKSKKHHGESGSKGTKRTKKSTARIAMKRGPRLMISIRDQAKYISAGGFPFLEEEWEYTYGPNDLTKQCYAMPVV